MTLLIVVLAVWVLLSLPVAALMGRSIERGLSPAPRTADPASPDPAPRIPAQRAAGSAPAASGAVRQAVRIQA